MYILTLFKIKIHDKVFIGSTYNYQQFIHKFKSTNYFSKIKKYVLLYDYIIQNNVNMDDIELELFDKKTYAKKDNTILISGVFCVMNIGFIKDDTFTITP